MDENKYIEQLKDIHTMMDRSSRFVSLSGLSGVLAGIYAIFGAIAAHYVIRHNTDNYVTMESRAFSQVIGIAALVLVLSLVSALILSKRKAAKRNETLWNPGSRRLLINFSIPLVTGGLFGLALLKEGHFGWIAPITMIFYGLALINASKYTLETIRSLGFLFIILGLICTQFPGYGLHFWAAGFGLCHIIYGTLMYFQFDRNSPR